MAGNRDLVSFADSRGIDIEEASPETIRALMQEWKESASGPKGAKRQYTPQSYTLMLLVTVNGEEKVARVKDNVPARGRNDVATALLSLFEAKRFPDADAARVLEVRPVSSEE